MALKFTRPAAALPRLYAVVDVELAAGRGWRPGELAAAFLDGGAMLLRLRSKSATGRELLELCDDVVSRAAPYGASVVLNDRPDLACLSGAAGVHVGQEDLPASSVRRLIGRERLLGLSSHTEAQIAAALAEPIDYLAVGPVFGTATKDTGYEPVGLDLVRVARAAAGELPVVAIGGVTLARAAAVIEAGARSVAVISDLLAGPPAARVRQFLSALS